MEVRLEYLVVPESDEGLRNDGTCHRDTGSNRKVLPMAKSRTV